MKRISIAGPLIGKEDAQEVATATLRDNLQNTNYSINLFEKNFANYVDRKYATTTSSCTAAIHLALLAIGVSAGDEVIVPEITWVASAAPVCYVGAKPIFVDIDPKTWCIDCESVKHAISDKTKAIIGVNLYGCMVDWDPLIKLCKEYNIYTIEDAAESIGSKYSDRTAGSFGDISVFSFHGSKTLSTGEGGMLVTNDKKLYQRVEFLKNHGRGADGDEFYTKEIGYKYKMSAIQAALGNSQLKKIDKLIHKKRLIFSWYKEIIGSNEDFELNYTPSNVFNSYWLTTILFKHTINIKKLRQQLDVVGIDTREVFKPLSSLPAFRKIIQSNEAIAKDNPNAYQLINRGINLPSALTLEYSDVEYVCKQLLLNTK